MSRDDDDEDEQDVETTMASGSTPIVDPTKEIDSLMTDLEVLLKNGDVVAILSGRGVNASLAMLGVSGMRNLLGNRKLDAAEDFGTLAEELTARVRLRESSEPAAPRDGDGAKRRSRGGRGD